VHGSVINVLANIDKIQSVLPCLSEDGSIVEVLIKCCLEYKSPFIFGNVLSNMIMLPLKDLLNTPLYRELNVWIHILHRIACLLYVQKNWKYYF